MAIGLFVVSMICNAFGVLQLAERYLTYLCVAGELIQLGVSLYVAAVRRNRPAPIEYVEQVDVVDQYGRVIQRTEKPVQAGSL